MSLIKVTPNSLNATQLTEDGSLSKALIMMTVFNFKPFCQ